MDVNLSKAVRSNLLSLQNTATMMGSTQERLATGLKVNSALDNPTNFFTSSSLKSRAGDLGQLMDSVSNAVQTIQAADKGISAMTKLVESAQATARQALQTSATVEETTAATAATVTGGTFTSLNVSTTGDSVSFDIAVDGGAATTVTIDSTAVTDYNTANGTSLDDTALSADDVVALINDQVGSDVASVDTDGAIEFTSSTTGATSQIEITNFDDTQVTGGSTGIANADVSGDDAVTTESVNPKRAELVDQYNELLTQIDDLAKDASFNGVNLLNGDDLQVIFNEDGSSKLDITGVDFGSTGLGLTELSADAFDTNDDINATLDSLKTGIEDLRTQASKFGSNLSVVETRQDFTKDMVNVLETGAANLTMADTNEEAANLLALQTRQQLSSTALSMASQSDQAVLRLF